MKITFHGGAGWVTGSNYLLEFADHSNPTGKRKILIDCGLFQGSSFCEKLNYEPFPYDPKEISEVFVTHAHIDHTGRLPKLINSGFKGAIYSTPPTKEFAEFLLLDSEHLLAEEAEHMHKAPIYNTRDINLLMRHWQGVPYHRPIHLGGSGATATLFSAGHILGSSSILIEAEGKKVLFSGDLGNSPAPLIGPAEAPAQADYCLIESAYGNREHEDMPHRRQKLEQVIEETIRAGGALMIPAFALERAQILLLELHDMLKRKEIPAVPIFIDSPLAIKLTGVYSRYRDYLKEELAERYRTNEAIFDFPNLRMTMTTDDSKSINEVPNPKIIIAGSGMSHGGRILHHERRYLPDPKSTLLIFGYQATGSLGRLLLDGAKSVRMFGEDVPVRAKVKAIGAYSAHADQSQLLDWLKPLAGKVKKVFVVQGEEDVSPIFAAKAKEVYGMNTYVPKTGESVELT